jgi:hypothetical protein
MIDLIKRIYHWWLSVAGQNPWFTFDKFAHGWLYTFIAAFLHHRLAFNHPEAFAIATCLGFLYEAGDMMILNDPADSIKDLVWNTAGILAGLCI